MQLPIPNGQISDIIGAIYDCAVDPAGWPGALAMIMPAIGCRTASFTLTAFPLGTFQIQASSGISDADLEKTRHYSVEIAGLWGGPANIMAHPVEEPAVLSRITPRADILGNRYYREWGVPLGLDDLIAVFAARDARAYGAIGFGRHNSAGPVREDELDLLRLLIPHIQRSVGISRMLDVKTVEASTLETALDAVASAIVLVDATLRIVHANRAGAAMLALGAPIADIRGRLSTQPGIGQEALAAAVAQAGKDEAGMGRRGFGLPARHADGAPAVLHVLPLGGGQIRPGIAPRATAAVFVAPAIMPQPASDQALSALFDLTPAEAKVFALIAAGNSASSAAETLGVAHNTVKTHLLRLFAKTGTRRQVDLVRLASSLSLSS